RHVKPLSRCGDHVEIWHRWLNHNDVRAFLDVKFDLAHGLAQIGAVHLVGPAVSKLRQGISRLAKRSIKTGSKFRGVREDRTIRQTSFVESLTNRGDAPIDHVRRSKHYDPI